MNSMKIDPKNAEQITAAINEVGGRAAAAFKGFEDVERVAAWAERRLKELGISKKASVGVRAVATSGNQVSRSYGWSRKATKVVVVRRASGWFLESVEATKVGTYGGNWNLRIPKAAWLGSALLNNDELVDEGGAA
jgi:hypothetical protein